MNVEKILKSRDWKKCIEFHGHTCPGVALGYRAAKAGLELLKESRSPDEELVTIVETDACDADAVQVLTGCTFGKGNFIYKEYGKHAFTFFSRNTGKGFRVVLKAGAFEPDEKHQALARRVREGRADEKEQAEFKKLHFQRTCDVLTKPLEQLFSIKAVDVPVPEKARIMASKICDRCGEPAMATRMTEVDGKWVCRGCLESQA
ncbi:MAG: FmdE family protein [Thermodesulfobacteriota bacterium]